ncbi:DUF1015 domain-containing protein [Algoriphagus boritolerans]|uniref:Uncharacterized conserved protein, DUF1015 family n=1 Tax=Algoriphagus boritolerans DSM 17298 = JCM 18970 TaxID=1120964 RepID=A0A1H5TUB2_9BACT|nr:DUF1015 domain-containing protein [Algoriphagus boritolerans]SEF65641.1 Uncharacterized conserved protein, DUF1015 family [Algoriphagus boritolerans DSM 17298 = JCM 18970]
MAEILPLRAWRYNEKLSENLEELTAPLFDVVSPRQRELLYSNPLNSIHLSVPQGENPAKNAKEILSKWKSSKVIIQDHLPGIYVYYQYFRLPGDHEERCRKGFIAQIKAYDWEENEILRHENTIISAVNDRIELLQSTEIQASPTHGLYEDESNELEGYMDAAIAAPLCELEDYQGVREVLGVIHDAKIISRFLAVLADKKVILADGHHRLEGAIAYKNLQHNSFPATKWKGSDYHLMYLTNVHGNHLKILPTHRLFYGLDLPENELMDRIKEWFDVRVFGDADELVNYTFQRKWSFGLVFSDEAYVIKFKQDKFEQVRPDLPEVLRNLDLVILHHILFEKILGLNSEQQRKSDQLAFERNFSRCVREVRSQEASFAIITREIELEQVLEVCKSGAVMPQKSTYFYPKALGGMLFGSIKQEEFDYDYGAFFEQTSS